MLCSAVSGFAIGCTPAPVPTSLPSGGGYRCGEGLSLDAHGVCATEVKDPLIITYVNEAPLESFSLRHVMVVVDKRIVAVHDRPFREVETAFSVGRVAVQPSGSIVQLLAKYDSLEIVGMKFEVRSSHRFVPAGDGGAKLLRILAYARPDKPKHEEKLAIKYLSRGDDPAESTSVPRTKSSAEAR